jgi:hypothetical protein
MLRHDGGDDDVGKEVADLAQAHRSDQGSSGQRGHGALISILIGIMRFEKSICRVTKLRDILWVS